MWFCKRLFLISTEDIYKSGHLHLLSRFDDLFGPVLPITWLQQVQNTHPHTALLRVTLIRDLAAVCVAVSWRTVLLIEVSITELAVLLTYNVVVAGWAVLVPSLEFNGPRLKREQEMEQSLLNAKATGMWENDMLMNAYCVNKWAEWKCVNMEKI